jgi:ABC-type phosphate/phosphonate transport system substrate-binding protein
MRVSIAVVIASSALLTRCHSRQPAEYMPTYGSSPAAASSASEYSFGVPAIRHVRSLWDRYAHLIKELNESGTGFVLRMESGQTSDAYDAKLRDGVFDIAIVDPYQVLIEEARGYTVIARTGKPERIRGVIVIARDSRIRDVRDLRGRTIAFINPTALAATLLNQYELFQSGLDVRNRNIVVYTRSPETSLLSVSMNRAEAAAVSMSDWEEFCHDLPYSAGQLTILRQTDDLSGLAVMASKSVSLAHVQSLRAALMRLASTAKGRDALRRAGISGFEPADTVSYDDVWDFLQRYRHVFGHLPDRMASR